jgi:hypothetical protein
MNFNMSKTNRLYPFVFKHPDIRVIHSLICLFYRTYEIDDCMLFTCMSNYSYRMYVNMTLSNFMWLFFCRSFINIHVICILRYSMYNDHISYLVNGWWDFYKHGIILKDISNKNNPPQEFSKFSFVFDLSHF